MMWLWIPAILIPNTLSHANARLAYFSAIKAGKEIEQTFISKDDQAKFDQVFEQYSQYLNVATTFYHDGSQVLAVGKKDYDLHWAFYSYDLQQRMQVASQVKLKDNQSEAAQGSYQANLTAFLEKWAKAAGSDSIEQLFKQLKTLPKDYYGQTDDISFL